MQKNHWLVSLLLTLALSSGLFAPALAKNSPPSTAAPRPAAVTSSLPGFYDTSAYLIGSVSVGIVFVESSGSGEDWSLARQAEVSTQIDSALTDWLTWGGMDASLSFVTDTRTVTIAQEPITLPSSDTSWIYDTMNAISGVSGPNAHEKAVSFDNLLRSANATDWAITILVVDSLNDADGAFEDGRYAWGALYGPYAVLTYDNGPQGISTLEISAAREIGHLFGAGYQEDGNCASQSQLFGYLGIANQYCVLGGVDPHPEISPRLMKEISVLGTPDTTTMQQIGWRDSDTVTDFIYDPVDVGLTFNLPTYDPNPTAASALWYSGSAQIVAYPHAVCGVDDKCYPRDVSISYISDLQLRVDSGAASAITPTDGTFDSQDEIFSFTAPVSGDGIHTVDVDGYTSHTNDLIFPPGIPSATFSDSVTISSTATGDDAAAPIVIDTFPFDQIRDTTTDTTSWDDPAPVDCDGNPLNDLKPGLNSVWYQVTPATDMKVSISAVGTDERYDTYLAVYTGARGNLTQLICLDDDLGGKQPSYLLNASAGTTYLIEFATFNGFIATRPQPLTSGGNLVVHFDSIVPVTASMVLHRSSDYNGDGKADVAVYRPSTGTWYIQSQGSSIFGNATDIPVPGDYNGDGKTELAIFRPSTSTWYIKGMGPIQYGQEGDIPVVGDYNGDHKDDIAIFRPWNNTWYIKGVGAFIYAKTGDVPVVGDYNGDGKDDIAIFRASNNTWYIKGIGSFIYANPGDLPVVADYNGDGKDDIAIFRASNNTWYIKGVGSFIYAIAGDVPVPGDYNGDGKAEIAIFRPSNSTWYIKGIGPRVFGISGDIPE